MTINSTLHSAAIRVKYLIIPPKSSITVPKPAWTWHVCTQSLSAAQQFAQGTGSVTWTSTYAAHTYSVRKKLLRSMADITINFFISVI